ncbi:MAG TPA: tetratricopeptide repeat protein [Bacteroidia bacterium]
MPLRVALYASSPLLVPCLRKQANASAGCGAGFTLQSLTRLSFVSYFRITVFYLHLSKKKKNKRKETSGEGEVTAQKQQSKKAIAPTSLRLYFAIIALFAFVLYFNTTQNGFAFDDSVVITQNNYIKNHEYGKLLTHDLFAGIYGQSLELTGGRFRPLPLLTHAIEYNFWGIDHPGRDHFVNILLYALAGLVLFLTLKQLLKGELLTSFIATLLFIAHPIHTEVVANIKSRDEIICFIFLMLTLFFLLRFYSEGTKKLLYYSFLFYLLSLFSKEHGITFLAIIPLTLYFFTDELPKNILKRTLPFAGIAVFYLLLRSQLLHTSNIHDSTDVMENPFYGVPFGEKLATISHILGKYLLLLFFPHPLSCDYSYAQIPYIGWGSLHALVPLLVYLSLGIFAIMTSRKKNIFSFCILFFLITISIVSNIFFNIGAPMGERFVFLPSMAVCLAVAVALVKWLRPVQKPGQLLPAKITLPLLVLLVPASIKTFSRNPDWKDNETLFGTDVQTVPNSGKANYYYANVLYNDYVDSSGKNLLSPERKKYLLETSKKHTLIAANIAPRFFHAHLNLGKIYIELGQADSAIYHLDKVVEIIPPSTQKIDGKTVITASEKYMEAMQDLARAWAVLKQNPGKAIEILNTALQYGQNNPTTLMYLGRCNAMLGKNDVALDYYNRSLQYNPSNAEVYQDLSQMYNYMGNKTKAQECAGMAARLKAAQK